MTTAPAWVGVDENDDDFTEQAAEEQATVEVDEKHVTDRVMDLLEEAEAQRRYRARLRGATPSIATRAMDLDGLLQLQPPNWLVADLLPEVGLAFLTGQPGVFKSFFALHVATAIAAGEPVFGHPAIPGPVLYIAAEGIAGQRARVEARLKALRGTGRGPAHGVWFDPGPLDLLDEAQIADIAEFAVERGVKLVIVDTLARCTPGANENSAQDMGQAIHGLSTIKDAGGGRCVYVVHHATKASGTESDPIRGSSALRGAADTVHHVVRTGPDVIAVKTIKQKDAEELPPLHLAFCPVSGTGSGILDQPTRPEHLRQLIGAGTATGTPEQGLLDAINATPGISQKPLLDAVSDPAGSSRTTLRRLLKTLELRGDITSNKVNGRLTYQPKGRTDR